jgi:hypothetical protein
MLMTPRDRLLTMLRGGVADRIPWNIYAWLLPQTEAGRRLHGKGLGVMGSVRACRAIHEGVTITEEQGQGAGRPVFRVRIETPVGTLTEEATREPYHDSRWIRKFFIGGPEDYTAAEYLFRHTRFEPDPQPWVEADQTVGDGGIAVSEIMPLPILYLAQYWMGVEGMAEGIYLYPDRFEALLYALEQHYLRQAELAAAGPAEVIWFPESITATVISPVLFQRYCLPLYRKAIPLVRGAGKLITAHYDGAIRPYLDLLREVDIPIIEAFTPPPMGDVTVGEAKAAWPDKVIWVNFPGCCFHESGEAIRAYTLELLEEGAPGGRLVIGCTEDFPVDQFEKTFTAIGQALAEYEGYPW